MLDTLKNAALAALIVFALVYATGIADHTTSTRASYSPAKTYPSTKSGQYAGAAKGRTIPCSYDGDFTNDAPGCK